MYIYIYYIWWWLRCDAHLTSVHIYIQRVMHKDSKIGQNMFWSSAVATDVRCTFYRYSQSDAHHNGYEHNPLFGCQSIRIAYLQVFLIFLLWWFVLEKWSRKQVKIIITIKNRVNQKTTQTIFGNDISPDGKQKHPNIQWKLYINIQRVICVCACVCTVCTYYYSLRNLCGEEAFTHGLPAYIAHKIIVNSFAFISATWSDVVFISSYKKSNSRNIDISGASHLFYFHIFSPLLYSTGGGGFGIVVVIKVRNIVFNSPQHTLFPSFFPFIVRYVCHV